jgi:thiol:disulfide interchange protein DsbD
MMSLLPLVQAGLADSLQQQPLLALVTLFGAGVLTSLTPCIYPMIPITAGVLGAAGGGATRRRVALLTLTYVMGLALLYAFLGMLAGLTGSLFGGVASSWWARLIIGNLLLLFALAMFDVVPMSAPQRIVMWAGRLGGGSYPAVFLLGATSGLVAAPCGAPAFAAVLTWVATTGNGALGFLYLFVFSIGMTALLVAVGVFSGTLTSLPKAGPWMAWVKRGAGVVMLVMAQYYFIQAGMVWW